MSPEGLIPASTPKPTRCHRRRRPQPGRSTATPEPGSTPTHSLPKTPGRNSTRAIQRLRRHGVPAAGRAEEPRPPHRRPSVTYRSPRGAGPGGRQRTSPSDPGESVGLVGEERVRKSTMGGPYSGSCRRWPSGPGGSCSTGVDLSADPDAWRQARGDELSLVFQDPATRLDPLQRIDSHFVELIRAHRSGTSKADAARLAREALAAVGVPPARPGSTPTSSPAGCASGS